MIKLALLALFLAPALQAQTNAPNLNTAVVTGGQVFAMTSSGGITYIGGSFGYVGLYTGAGVPIDVNTGKPVVPFPAVNGTVFASVSDGSGGWYVGGGFSQVGGVPCTNLAHILAGGTVDPTWNPSPNGGIQALARSGTILYVGGQFSSIGGQQRNNIAALDAGTGNATSWDPNANYNIFALTVNGSVVYAGGGFDAIGGQRRIYIAALDAATGAATAWNPGANNTVLSLAATGTTVYAGGSFTLIGGQPRNHIAALNAATGQPTAWSPNADQDVLTLAIGSGGSLIYAGGLFARIGGRLRNGLAALNATDGNSTVWDPAGTSFGFQAYIYSLAVTPSAVFVGGVFDAIGAQPRNNLAALDPITANALPWNPDADATPRTLQVDGTTLFAGGQFLIIGGRRRNNVAAIDEKTGQPTAWDPNTDGTVYSLAANGSTIYLGGGFSTIAGQPRNNIAAVDATAGNASAWNPNSDGEVYSLALNGAVLYAGGFFSNIGGQPRSNLVALDTATGNAAAWNPNVNGAVRSLAVNAPAVYIGGSFTSIGGQARNRIGAADATTGNVTPWNPGADNGVLALAAVNSTIYAGGNFSNIGGQPRNYLAALDAATGNATAWNPGANQNIFAFAVTASTVYVAGAFTAVGGQVRSGGLAALDPATGGVRAWTPDASGQVQALAVNGGTVFAGGMFDSVASERFVSFAQFGPFVSAADVTPPSAVTDLAIIGVTPSSVTLQWTAPSDPDSPVSAYDIRFASFALTTANFAFATPVATVTAPAAPGTRQTVGILGLTAQTTFFAALRSQDPAGNVSALGNVAGLVRSTTVVNNAAELTFTANQPVSAALLSTTSTTGALVLASATAQGLAFVSNIYNLGPEQTPFSPPAQLVFQYSTMTLAALAIPESQVALYQFVPGTGWVKVSGQAIDTINKTVSAPISILNSIFALLGPGDLLPPRTQLIVGPPRYDGPSLFVSSQSFLSFSAVDDRRVVGDGLGVGVQQTQFSLDAGAFQIYGASFTITAEGRHGLRWFSRDGAGNVEILQSTTVAVDMTAPVTTLSVGQPQFALSSSTLLVSSNTPFALVSTDPTSSGVASGVKQTSYQINGSTPAVYLSSFTLSTPDGPQVVSFFSQDNVLNVEPVRSAAVVLDATPPQVELLSPGANGICRVVKGTFTVLGMVQDANLAGYVLDFAPGQDAASGFTLISSATTRVGPGALGVWNAGALSGWQTLRLTATDLVQNVSVASRNVFVGDPAELMVLGSHELFDLPQDVAAGTDGRVYVVDTNADQIKVFSATGTFLSAFGDVRHERGDDDEVVSSGMLRFSKPRAAAVDAAGAVYVADTNHHRVLAVSATGQILLEAGRRRAERGGRIVYQPGSGLGEFNQPSGVAVDGAGSIYIADTLNHRIQVLSSSGAVKLSFMLPAAPASPGRRSGSDGDGDDEAALGRPAAVVVDGAGKIYVADPVGHRALVFGATGQLLLAIPISDRTPDGKTAPGQPDGIAVSPSGDCILVSDRRFGRVLKFDALGGQTSAFGAPGKIRDDQAPPPGIMFSKPGGLALAPDGTLLVADRNNDRVERFGLPNGRAVLVVPPPKPEDEHVARDVVAQDEGGKVERKDHAAVDIPAGAALQDLKITVSTPTASALDELNRKYAVGDRRLKAASPPVEYGPEGTRFAAPVTLTLPYNADLIARERVDVSDLRVHYWNRDKAQWQDLDSVVDLKTRTIQAQTRHFSLYQVFSGTASTAGLRPLVSGDPTFMFHDAYAFPNPARGVNAVTIRIQPGAADSVEVHVYDLSGRKVYSSSNFSLNTGLDDGNGKGFQYTYDHVWDVSGAGSGVYSYVLTARKAGQADIRKSGKLGVIK